MKITIESTERIVTVQNGHGGEPVRARIWEGSTASGIPVICVITRIVHRDDYPSEEFERELRECKPPSNDAIAAIPLHMIL